jgi:acyl-CoA reductase-like NAD-dependent aldehyde dehydrogenase
MLVTNEETFGPVAPVFRFKTEDEASAMANDTSSAWPPISTPAISAAIFRVAEALEYGMVGINSADLGTEVAPFGGVKEAASAARARITASRTISTTILTSSSSAAAPAASGWPASPRATVPAWAWPRSASGAAPA